MVNKDILQAQLKAVQEKDKQGTAWYSWLFTKAPQVKSYFGAENVQPSQIPGDAKFQKLGTGFLNKMSEFVNKSGDEAALRKDFGEFVVDHKQRHNIGDPSLYGAVGQIWIGYVESAVGMSDAQKAEWSKLFGLLGKEATEKVK